MTSSQDMIRGRSNVVTLTNNSGGALVAGDVCIQDTTGDEYVTTTTSANSTKQVVIAAEPIANGATGKFYAGGYCPLVTPSASVTRGRYLFTHTVAKQAAENATYGAGAFGVILESGTTPSVWLFGETNQGVGGTGITTYESAYASPPASPNEGDIWYITDSLLHARYTGAAWSYYYGTRSVYKPVLADFSTAFNMDTSTLIDKGQLILNTPATSANYIRGKVMSAPSLNYTIDLIFIPGFIVANYFGCGFCWSDGTQYIMFGLSMIGGAGLHVEKWTNTGVFSAAYTSLNLEPFAVFPQTPITLRVTEDNTNRTCFFSLDGGYNFHQFHQIGRTDFLTATQVGIMSYDDQTTYAHQMSLLSWHAY